MKPSAGQVELISERLEIQGDTLREIEDNLRSIRMALWILVWVALAWTSWAFAAML